MTESNEPCPFCGGIRLESGGDDKFVGVRCLDCEATGPNHYITGKDWNTRALSTPAPQVEREAIARVIDPECHFEDIEGVTWSRFDIAMRHAALAKADAILALGQATNSPGDAGASHNTGERNPSVMPDSSPGELRETGGVR